jgi:nucleotide-binding universal stress UspA family protein
MKVLIAVDDTKSTGEIFNKCTSICKCLNPEEVNLVYVEKYAGRSIIDDMLGENDLKTLKEIIEGSEFKEAMDAKAQKILNHYKDKLKDRDSSTKISTDIRFGHPAEEIIKAAQEKNVDMIIMGSRGQRSSSIFMGSVSREVSNTADRPVLIIR